MLNFEKLARGFRHNQGSQTDQTSSMP